MVIPAEARGLDVNADLLERFAKVDAAAHRVMERIYHDEIRHVETGTRWHHLWCAQRELIPNEHFAAVLNKRPTSLSQSAPLDYHGRSLTGFDAAEIALEPKPKAETSATKDA